MKIIFQEVGLRFGSHVLFRDLTEEIPSGAVTMIMGRNGSGKSTFLQLAAQLIPPDGGIVSAMDGEISLQKEAFRRQVAMVTPELKLYPRLTAAENLRFFLGLRGITLSEEEIFSLWERVGLVPEEVRHPYAVHLSTGMQQRVKLAVLLASQSCIWILDEPGANLDAAGSQMIFREARQAAEHGVLVLWATNDPGEEAAADAIIRLSGD